MTAERDPWAASFADVARLGLETASMVVERLLELSRRAPGFRITGLPATSDGAQTRQVRADAERLIDLYADWSRSMLDAAVGVVAPGPAAGPGVITLGPIRRGEEDTATAWLHLEEATGAVPMLRATDLSHPSGPAIPGATIRIEVATDGVSPRRVDVTVPVPDDAPPGVYVGWLLGDDPDTGLPIKVEVKA